ncbi:cupredoxin domain-containing protein [Candidatus Gottesmanbacteria bacterium]|nr:cupredoxin domain-containing protein [Candidatus Gottesmanbacteria bacterium]
MDKLIVTLLGATVIGFIYWFFFGKKDELVQPKNVWSVLVEGGYKPSTITIPRDKPTTLTFTRTDANSCLEEIVLPDFKIKKFLPLDKEVVITIPPTKPGIYTLHCGMNMYHGKIIVV